jgi:hypothetical protein
LFLIDQYKKNYTTYANEIPGRDLGQAQTCGGVKRVHGIQPPLLIIGFLMTIWIIKYNTKPKQIFFHRKKNTIKKKNDNIYMDSTIAEHQLVK